MTLSTRPGAVLALLLAAPLSAQSIAGEQEMPPLDCVFSINPEPVVVHQPDGTPLELSFRGNGLHNWYEDAAGYPVVRFRDHYVYARQNVRGELRPTRLVTGQADPRAAGIPQHVVPAKRASEVTLPEIASAQSKVSPKQGGGPENLSGTVKNLVIMMRFSNHGPGGQNRTLPSQSDMDTIMNDIGGDPVLAPTGSVKDAYLEYSYGGLTIQSTVVGFFDVPESETAYANGNSGLTSKTWDLIEDGLDAADPSVDFSQFDDDGDGWIDAITFLHSGYGAEWGGNDSYGTNFVDRMWSHKWTIPTWTSGEGIKVADYHISPGLWGTSGSGPGRIGVVVHETGHFFGWPDEYDTNGSGQGIGNWCVMAAGSWGFDSSQQYPSHVCVWSKMKLGWLSPTSILPGAYNLMQVETNAVSYRIDNGYPPGESLLIENRQLVGFDAVHPQTGLAVWHVDDAKGHFGFNNVNTDQGYPGQGGWPGNNNHYRIALLQADGGYDMEHNFDRGDSGDIYHGAGVSSITESTTPSTDAYQSGTVIDNGNRITGISNSSANMSFTFANTSRPSVTTASLPVGVTGAPYDETLTASGGAGGNVWTERIASPSYLDAQEGGSSFASVGAAQGWNADDNSWPLDLPFAFPFYDAAYTRVYVSSNGFIDFDPGESEPANASTHLKLLRRIAPLWDDLRTDGGGEDIFVQTSIAGQVTIRWDARTFNGNNPCNFSVTLHDNGLVRFHYGAGNTGLAPSVGISRGEEAEFVLPSGYDRATSLTNADSYSFQLQGSQIPPGLKLATDGTLSGAPTQAGTFTPIFRTTDSSHEYDEAALSIRIFQASPPHAKEKPQPGP